MKIRNAQNFWAGIMFCVIGLGFAGFAQNYDMGSAQRMGPAYFPTILGSLMALLGAGVAISALGRVRQPQHDVEKFHFASIGWILASVIAFALTLRPLGLVVALIVLSLISGMGSHDRNLKQLVLLTIGLVLLVLGVFIWGLGLTLPVWPAFMDR